MGKKIKLVVDNAKKKYGQDIAEVDLVDDEEITEMLAFLAHLASAVSKKEISGFAAVTIAADKKSTGSLFTPSVADDIHLILAGLDLLKDRIKDECLSE